MRGGAQHDDALSSLAAAAIIGINLDWSSGLQRKTVVTGD
jgi:hypothetical protein